MAAARRKLVLGSFYKLISSLLIALIGLVTSAIVNRHYGMHQYGLLVMVFTITGFFVRFADVGAEATFYKMIPSLERERKERETSEVIFTGLLVFFCGTFICAAIIYLFRGAFVSYYKVEGLLPLITAGVFYFIGFCFVEFAFCIAQSFQSWFIESSSTVLYPLLYLILIIFMAFVMKSGNIITVLYSNIAASFITGIVVIYSLRSAIKFKYLKDFNFLAIKRQLNKFIFYGLPLLFPEQSSVLVSWVDKLFLGKYSGTDLLSVYYIAFTLINGLMIFVKVPFIVTLPHASSISGQDEVKKSYDAFFRINLFLSIGVSSIFFCLIDWIVNLFYGPGYTKVAFVFKLLLPVVVIKSASLSSYIFLRNVFAKVGIINLGMLLMAFLEILLCFLFIPRFGVFGAIAAILISRFIHTFWFLCFVKEIRRITDFRTIYRSIYYIILLGCIYKTLCYFKLGQPYITLPVILAVYVFILLRFKEIDFVFYGWKKKISNILSTNEAVQNGI